MRFIFNFFFFGILFYLIHIYFPDAFNTLVGWADKVFIFLRDLVISTWAKIQGTSTTAPAPSPVPEHAWLAIPMLWESIKRKF